MMVDRRTILIGGGAFAAAAAVGACSGQGTAASGGVPEAGAELAAASAVPVEGGVVNQDLAVVVTQPSAGEFKAFTAVCPHQGCLVSSVEANEIVCPCHGSRFSAVDGAVLAGPATTGLASAKVVVEGDRVVLA